MCHVFPLSCTFYMYNLTQHISMHNYLHLPHNSLYLKLSLLHPQIMTLFATRYRRSIASCRTNMNWQRSFVSPTTPKYKSGDTGTGAKLKSRADLFPIYILFGFCGGAIFLAVKSVTQQLVHHPGVQVNKTKRSMVPEVDNPDSALVSGDKFITKSVLRKVAHIQKREDMDGGPDIYTSPRSAESTTLKTVGVETAGGPRR